MGAVKVPSFVCLFELFTSSFFFIKTQEKKEIVLSLELILKNLIRGQMCNVDIHYTLSTPSLCAKHSLLQCKFLH